MRSVITILIVSAHLMAFGQARPQFLAPSGTRNNPAGGFRPILNSDSNIRRAEPVQPSARVTPLSPAFPPPELYVGPKFDQFGESLTSIAGSVASQSSDYQSDYYDDYQYDDDYYYDEEEQRLPQKPQRPKLARPSNSNLGPDLQPRLPNFDVLHATQVLRSRDKDQQQLLDPGQVNAGILPLAFENPSKLGLFPPLIDP